MGSELDKATRESYFAIAAMISGSVAAGTLLGVTMMGKSVDWSAVESVGTLVGAAVALFAVVLAVNGYRQGQDNLRQTRDAQILEHQAYMRGHIAELEVTASGRLLIHLSIENYGRTPASGVMVRFMLDIVTKEDKGITTTPLQYLECFRNDFYPDRPVDRVCDTDIVIDWPLRDHIRLYNYKFKGAAEIVWNTVFEQKKFTVLLINPGRLRIEYAGIQGFTQ